MVIQSSNDEPVSPSYFTKAKKYMTTRLINNQNIEYLMSDPVTFIPSHPLIDRTKFALLRIFELGVSWRGFHKLEVTLFEIHPILQVDLGDYDPNHKYFHCHVMIKTNHVDVCEFQRKQPN